MGRFEWYRTCPNCKYRYGWNGPMYQDPGCPKCNPGSAQPVATATIPEGVQEVVEKCDEILEDIDEIPERGYEFAEGVKDTVVDIRESIVKVGYASNNQRQALDNIHAGVRKWLH